VQLPADLPKYRLQQMTAILDVNEIKETRQQLQQGLSKWSAFENNASNIKQHHHHKHGLDDRFRGTDV
jgi:hypothetical protein